MKMSKEMSFNLKKNVYHHYDAT